MQTDTIDERLVELRAEAGDPVLDRALARVRAALVAPALPDTGRYRLRRPLGSGGFGDVFEADDTALARRVAVKLQRFASEQLSRRFVAEAQALAQLEHPNVVRVFDVGHLAGGGVYIVMELVEGETLATWLRGDRSVSEILSAFREAAAGLAAAHDARIVHRDFKPGNVLVGRDGRVRVADFGLARPIACETPVDGGHAAETVTHASGTPRYMSPEQRAGRLVDERTDVYSFSVVLFEALYGRLPGDGALDRTLSVDASGIPRPVRDALAAGLAVDVDERLRSMRPWLRALESRRRPWVGVSALAVAVLVAGAAIRDPTDSRSADSTTSDLRNEAADRARADRSLAAEQLLDENAAAEAIAAADVEIARASAAADAEAVAAALLVRGRAELLRSADVRARDDLEAALSVAEEADDRETAAWAALTLAGLVELGWHDEARVHALLRIAEAAIDRLGRPCRLAAQLRLRQLALAAAPRSANAEIAELDDLLDACPETTSGDRLRLVLTQAHARAVAGDNDGNLALLLETVVETERQFGADSPRLVVLLRQLAMGYARVGEVDRAAQLLERELEIADLHGLDEGVTDLSREALAAYRNDAALARANLERTTLRGAAPLRLAAAHLRIAGLAFTARDWNTALRGALRASIELEGVGALAADIAHARGLAAECMHELGEFDRAEAARRDLVEDFDGRLPDDDVVLLASFDRLALYALDRGEVGGATLWLERLRAAAAIDPTWTGYVRRTEALLELKAGRIGAASERGREAIALLEQDDPDEADRLRRRLR